MCVYRFVLSSWQILAERAAAWTKHQPETWGLLVAILTANAICTRAAGRLIAASPVALNLVLCVQRFLSVVISATLLSSGDPPGLHLWVGALLVTAGCYAYATGPRPRAVTPSPDAIFMTPVKRTRSDGSMPPPRRTLSSLA